MWWKPKMNFKSKLFIFFQIKLCLKYYNNKQLEFIHSNNKNVEICYHNSLKNSQEKHFF